MEPRVDFGFGCKGFEEHVHTETMGWPAHYVTRMIYLTHGAPLTINGVPHEIYPGKVLEVRADTPHGVLQSDGKCPETGLPRGVVLISFDPRSIER